MKYVLHIKSNFAAVGTSRTDIYEGDSKDTQSAAATQFESTQCSNTGNQLVSSIP